MREYETLYLLAPETQNPKIEELRQRLTQALRSKGGEELSYFNWGKRKLSYLVNKNRYGVYIYLNYASEDGQAVNEIERLLRNDESVMKFITVKLDEQIELEERRVKKREFTLTHVDDLDEKVAFGANPPAAEPAAQEATTE